MDEIVIIIIVIVLILFIYNCEGYRLWSKRRMNKPLLNEQFLNSKQFELHQEL